MLLLLLLLLLWLLLLLNINNQYYRMGLFSGMCWSSRVSISVSETAVGLAYCCTYNMYVVLRAVGTSPVVARLSFKIVLLPVNDCPNF